MAWIESHQSLKDHPKMSNLCSYMGWEQETCIGKLHLFWWWCLDYAQDGDLRKYSAASIANGMRVPVQESEKLLDAMVQCGFIDRFKDSVNDTPSGNGTQQLRVHDWWQYVGRFLQSKYRHAPDKWKRIRDLYECVVLDSVKDAVKHVAPNQPTDLPNLTQYDKHTVKDTVLHTVSPNTGRTDGRTDLGKAPEGRTDPDQTPTWKHELDAIKQEINAVPELAGLAKAVVSKVSANGKPTLEEVLSFISRQYPQEDRRDKIMAWGKTWFNGMTKSRWRDKKGEAVMSWERRLVAYINSCWKNDRAAK